MDIFHDANTMRSMGERIDLSVCDFTEILYSLEGLSRNPHSLHARCGGGGWRSRNELNVRENAVRRLRWRHSTR